MILRAHNRGEGGILVLTGPKGLKWLEEFLEQSKYLKPFTSVQYLILGKPPVLVK
jgi:hypothetical protein